MRKSDLLQLAAAAMKTEAYSIVFPTVLFSISQIVIHAILPQVIVELVCHDVPGRIDCTSTAVSEKASLVNLISSFTINIPCVFLIGFYASYAKKYGLKIALLTPIIGNLLFLTTILAARHTKAYFSTVMIGSLISGLSGGRNCFMMATFAYAADVTTTQERSKVFSVIEISIYTAKILCPFTVGILSRKYGFGLALFLGISVCLFNILWILLVMNDPVKKEDTLAPPSPTLKDSLSTSSDDAACNEFSIRKRTEHQLVFHPFATFHSMGRLFGKNALGNVTVPVISGVYFIYHMIAVGVHVIEILFVKHKFHWDPYVIGIFGSVNGIMEILSMLAAPVIAYRLLGLAMTDLNWIEIGLWARGLFFCFFGFATNGFELFSALSLLIFCGPVVPRIKSYLSKSVGPQQQSELFAALAAIDAISAFLSPVFTAAYFRTVASFPGYVFEIIAILYVLSGVTVYWIRQGSVQDVLDYLPTSSDAM